MSNDLSIPFDRIAHRDGQKLTARDLNDEQRRESRLRAAHNRYLHATWGITLGFKVKAMAGNQAVIVGAGYAIDAEGSDLVLSKSLAIPVPDVNGTEMFVLTAAAAREEAKCDAGRQDKDICQDEIIGERPSFQWRRPLGARFGLEVPLVAVTVAQGTIQGELNLRVRRYARRDVRPHVNMEKTEAGGTGWQTWAEGPFSNLGLEVTVDTSEAGFNKEPQYFAVLHGDFSNHANKPPLFANWNLPQETKPAFLPGAFGFITAASATSFTYRIICIGQPPFIGTITPAEAESRGWHITWLGIESGAGSEPSLDLIKIFPLFASI